MFDPRILIFAYADVLKAKGANTEGGDKTNLDGINVQNHRTFSFFNGWVMET